MIAIETIQTDLQKARNAGKMNEVADLSLILEHRLHRPMKETDAYLKALRAALNRYNQRRFRRGVSDARSLNPYKVGVKVIVPSGEVWTIGRVEPGYIVRKEGEGKPGSASFECLTLADQATAPSTPSARQAACDALYHAVSDYCDALDDRHWVLEQALDAYEKALDGL